MSNKFSPGTGCFSCESCGRRTRDTGVQSIGSKICPDCYEVAGIDNAVTDGDMTNEEGLKAARRYIDRITAKGGNTDKVKAECQSLNFSEAA